MSKLKYNKIDKTNFPFLSYEELEKRSLKALLDDMNYRVEKLKEKEDKIDDLIYEKELITRDIAGAITTDICFSRFNIYLGFKTSLFEEALRYFWHKSDTTYWKEKPEEKKKCKNAFNFVREIIYQKLLKNNEEYKLLLITNYNFGKAYRFEFKYKNQIIEITIPMWERATCENFKEFLYGYQVLYRESEHVNILITHDIDPNKVADALEKWVKENATDKG